jgi:hypothetical protein
MFRGREEIRKQISELVAKFREKGALSPEKAMTSEELGLPPRFKRCNAEAFRQNRNFRGS